jgi:hypothetical protein
MVYIVTRAAEEVIDANHVVPLAQQLIAQMGAQETGTTRNEDTFRFCFHASRSFYYSELLVSGRDS